MREYTFFPGCSFESTGLPIKMSIEATNPLLDIQLEELEDWTCCGCAGAPISELGGLAMATRNLALAEKTGKDMIAACSCCYRNLYNAHHEYTTDPRIKAKLDEALGAANLKYNGGARIRGLVDIYIHDVGLDLIASKVKKKLTGLKVACWYGCHQTRPYGPDDYEFPQWMDQIVEVLGAETVQFPLKAQCCGGAQIMPEAKMAGKLIQKLLDNAINHGAQAMVTTLCPLCFTTLDAFQGQFTSESGRKFNMPIIALSQIMGMAFGLSPRVLGLDKNVTPVDNLLAPYYSLTTAKEV
jgi:heterodisulfide reductase subunit B2